MPKPLIKQYNRKLKIFSNGMVELTEYINPVYSDVQEEKDEKNVCSSVGRIGANDINYDDDNYRIRYDSLARSRNILIDYACENDNEWKSFITLTFAENIQDLTIANRKFHSWRSKFTCECKKREIDFKYLGVPEFQKRGAVHYHLLTNIDIDSDMIPKQINGMGYDVKYWKYGFSSAFDVINKTDDNFNIALYITKYLYKDFDTRLYGRNRVLKSNNLKKPVIAKLSALSDIYKTAYSYINEKYDMEGQYTQSPCEETPFVVPYVKTTFNNHNDNIILMDILQNELEF